jgi:hypothetical protein
VPGKHGWNSRENYFDIHFKVLRFFEPYMTPPVQYKHEVVTDAYEIREATKIVFTTWTRNTVVHASLRKDIMIRRTPGTKPEAKAYSYRYHANLPDGRALLRYCSPDDPNLKVDPKNHHTFHHKHIFDHLGTEVKVVDVQNRSEEWPHVSDFLNELLSTF